MKQQTRQLWLLPLVSGLMGWMADDTLVSEKSHTMDITTVKSLNVERFMGRWFEIARYDHRFEEGMTHVTADYSLLPNGKIQVINRGVKAGRQKEIIGKAKQPDPVHYPGRLEVSFFLWFYSDYYIFELDDAYSYAVIGSSSDKYLWILSRTPQMASTLLEKLKSSIKQRGYDLSRLVMVEQ